MRTDHKLRLLLLLILLAIVIVAKCQSLLPPPTPPPVVVKLAYTYYMPIMTQPVPTGKKGAAGFASAAAAVTTYGTMGVRHAYDWGHLCKTVHLVNYGLNCNHHLRSNLSRTWNSYADDCAPNTTEAEVKACTIASAAAYPGRVWLIGNEPDGGDPNYSDYLTPSQAAEKYGEVLQTVKSADPNARTYCCGWVVPFDVNQHPSQFLTAYAARWGHPLSDDLTGLH